MTKSNYLRWLNSPHVNKETKNEILKMSEQEIDESFFKNIEFGTAGMRGILGPGTNKMNEFTIQKAAIGFGLYLKEIFPNANENGIVISHDNRHKSREFTLQIANIYKKMGFKTYIFDSLRPTPELSFAVNYLQAAGGIMITASHNPKNYNGFKVYDEFGCQLVPDKIERLIEIINDLGDELEIKIPLNFTKGEIIILTKEIDDVYIDLVKKIQVNPHLRKKDFRIVYTPNHGSSYVNAMRIFNDLGYEVYPVLSQIDPDPDFKGTLSPNPEDEKSYLEPIKLAKKIKAHLIVMTDPDGDRVGVGFLNQFGEYELLSGNQSAALLIDYLFSQKQEKGTLSKNGIMYDTIVSSRLGRKIAHSYGVKSESFLTGFKFIGDRIQYYLENNGPTFEFGYEESYGCLIAPFARDKDGLQAILMYCEMALFHHLNGQSLNLVYDKLQAKHGYTLDITFSLEFKGSDGMEKMKNIMDRLSNLEVKKITNLKVTKTEDYMKSIATSKENITQLTLPKSDVIILTLADESTISIRPSGTEPKCKFYFGLSGKKEDDLKSKANLLFNDLKKQLGL
ncbi:MAG: phospho-sugar mutase [Bacilli bacterium]|nr:phospho-sugar mutase [Erysipelotrichia bacterium]